MTCIAMPVVPEGQEQRPPLGLTPKAVWIAQVNLQRLEDIKAAMARYIEVGRPIPDTWLKEYNHLAFLYTPAHIITGKNQ
ncbi:hypothetical protein [Hymenobacter fodinae]|uniref:Uncharacterized protein n=1 Tax=Hymenobacter fodinae TaxID=2510796 RepID=A0A4Z0P901_9BACT|nr:hypothetical protein [Hymenobacter fodinae]TGE08761.1 hypothetical protein EU556_13830 [Hymenobacter fodinae]